MTRPVSTFFSDITNFVEDYKALCVGTLGIAILFYGIGNLLGRAVTAIGECFGSTKKVDALKVKIPCFSTITDNRSLLSKKLSYDKKPTADELKKIDYIITSTGSCHLPALMMRRSELKQMGDELESMHPLRYISSIITNPKLKNELIKIKARGQKWLESHVWTVTFDRNVERLNKEAEQNNLLCYMDQFAMDLKLDSSHLTTLVKNKRWKEFFDALLAV